MLYSHVVSIHESMDSCQITVLLIGLFIVVVVVFSDENDDSSSSGSEDGNPKLMNFGGRGKLETNFFQTNKQTNKQTKNNDSKQ